MNPFVIEWRKLGRRKDNGRLYELREVSMGNIRKLQSVNRCAWSSFSPASNHLETSASDSCCKEASGFMHTHLLSGRVQSAVSTTG
ncbi:hypothetical protein GDO81_025128 [Engystomops pustulosus]|uniref:Uncharacterized protein n=1 Tax=Engystomops pustulosus TaxID=76066 RepID=A0AAV6ZMF4_ENGPU|nr:hypothetical protein GDO81_025128 [Engystomops pustulosus]